MQSHSAYSNFQDPAGLVGRMLFSGDGAARSALYLAGLGILFKPLDLALQAAEKRLVRQAKPSSLPIILIVGAPRSGTTLVYQVLARYLPMSYFSNFDALFPRSPIMAVKIRERLHRRRSFAFHSFYGNTAGLFAPNDGFHVWNRWLGNDRYRTPDSLTPPARCEMQTFFNAWLSAQKKPLLNKNNRNTDCIPLLGSVLENVRFIEVRRNPIFVAQSLLQARAFIQGSKQAAWGLGSQSAEGGDYIDAVCDQVMAIEMKVRRDKRSIAPGNWLRVSYENFCRNPLEVVEQVSRQFLGASLDTLKLQKELKPFEAATRIQISKEERTGIETRLQTLYSEEDIVFEGSV